MVYRTDRAATTTRPAVCCACAQQCGLLVHLDGERITRITGDKAHPSSAGFICSKGAHAHDFHYAPDRVHLPLERVGGRSGGQWDVIGWDQALDEIADKLRALAASDGPESVALGFGTLRGADWGIGERCIPIRPPP